MPHVGHLPHPLPARHLDQSELISGYWQTWMPQRLTQQELAPVHRVSVKQAKAILGLTQVTQVTFIQVGQLNVGPLVGPKCGRLSVKVSTWCTPRPASYIATSSGVVTGSGPSV